MNTETLVLGAVVAAAAFLVWRRMQEPAVPAPTSADLLVAMGRQAEPPLLETLQPSWLERGLEAGYF